MKFYSLILIPFFLASNAVMAAEVEKLKTERIVISPEQELSYALGVKIAEQWREEGLSVDPNIVAIAIADVQNYSPRRLSGEAGNIAIGIAKANVRQAKEAVWKAKRIEARAFMEENIKHADVITLDSGLQYVIHNEGEGASPKPESKISVSYTGVSATKGSIFGRVKAPSEGSEFDMTKVIKGWQEGLPLIKEGGKITLYVPAHLAYGREGIKLRHSYIIEPNDALVFEIELVKVLN